ncbi:hypothetical protein OGAPHI_001887 [Ogataea philodendri]|uniref:CinA C-terminal domain-containing protein n=1 Tax=Ogataea philodendri TaxID=1378263 RepID=A0A9P8T6I6_9ASCO|nr:uncharacterized protein OGAPHI_001887 [Ogataea philodendri]KAH3668133.1 hypothetical protein OGAPHI_001887 [Ogataea philodendri]
MHFPPDEIKILVEEIAQILQSRKQTLSVSEGACGGLLSAYLISLPGASKFFDGSRLIYSLKSRLKLSGWDTDQIRNYTGPSEAVVLRLARNLRIEFGSTYVLSESGFAGPSTSVGLGDQESITDSSKQGLVYLGVSGPNGDKSCVISTGHEDRSENMQLFAKKGLEFLLRVLREEGTTIL